MTGCPMHVVFNDGQFGWCPHARHSDVKKLIFFLFLWTQEWGLSRDLKSFFDIFRQMMGHFLSHAQYASFLPWNTRREPDLPEKDCLY